MKRKLRGFHIILMVVLIISNLIQNSCSGGGGSSGEEPEDIITVTSSCSASSGTDSTGAYCSLDDAIEAASAKSNPVLVLSDGEYSLSEEITSKLTIRSSSFSSSLNPLMEKSSTPLTCSSVGSTTTIILTNGAIISSSADDSLFRVRMANLDDTLKIQGVAIQPNTAKPAFLITSGHVRVDDSTISGSIIVKGEDSSAAVYGSILSISEIAEVERLLGSTESLGNNLYTSDEDCDENADYRAALIINDGATFLASNMEIKDSDGLGLYNREVGILADGPGTVLTMSDSAQVDTIGRADIIRWGFGVVLQNDAGLVASDISLKENEGPGLYMASTSSATITDSYIEDSWGAGIVVYNSTLDISGTTISGNIHREGVAAGIYVDNNTGGSTITVDQSTIENNEHVGLYLLGDGGTTTIANTSVLNTAADITPSGYVMMGNGIYALQECDTLNLDNNYYEANQGAHVFLDESNAIFTTSSTYVVDGSVDFVQQDCAASCITPLDIDVLYTLGLSAAHRIYICEGLLLTDTSYDFQLYLEIAEIGW